MVCIICAVACVLFIVSWLESQTFFPFAFAFVVFYCFYCFVIYLIQAKTLSKYKSQTVHCFGYTLVYAAPEVLRGDRYGKPADVYSYAIMLNELFSGQRPYSQQLKQSMPAHQQPEGMDLWLVEQVKNGLRPDLASGIPAALTALIEQSWDTSPDHRPSFVQIAQRLQSMSVSVL